MSLLIHSTPGTC